MVADNDGFADVYDLEFGRRGIDRSPLDASGREQFWVARCSDSRVARSLRVGNSDVSGNSLDCQSPRPVAPIATAVPWMTGTVPRG